MTKSPQSLTRFVRSAKPPARSAKASDFEKHTGALDWTEAQKKQMKRYQPGQVLTFHKM